MLYLAGHMIFAIINHMGIQFNSPNLTLFTTQYASFGSQHRKWNIQSSDSVTHIRSKNDDNYNNRLI